MSVWHWHALLALTIVARLRTRTRTRGTIPSPRGTFPAPYSGPARPGAYGPPFGGSPTSGRLADAVVYIR